MTVRLHAAIRREHTRLTTLADLADEATPEIAQLLRSAAWDLAEAASRVRFLLNTQAGFTDEKETSA